ncbi:unnamed protein product [Mucor fragilis]
MKEIKWQFSIFLLAIPTVFSLIVNAAALNEKRDAGTTVTTVSTTTHHHSYHHHKKHHHHHSSNSIPARATKTIRNCSLASIQQKHLKSASLKHHKLPRTQTVYVCDRSKHTKTTTKKHSTKKHNSQSSHKKSVQTKSKSKKHSTSTKHKSKSKSKKHTTTTTTKHKSKKHSTSTKTRKVKAVTTTHKSSETSTSSVVAEALPTADITLTTTSIDNNNNADNSNTNNDAAAANNNDDNNNSDDTDDAAASAEDATATAEPLAAVAGAGANPTATTTPDDNNNQVSVQSINNGQTIENEPQSKVIGISVGAVVGCLAAAGLAGMFIYKRKQNSKHDQDVEDLNQTSEVNTRWRTQSFMAVVAGAVAKLPNRSNSSSSTRSVGVLGTIRRAASNASSKLSRSTSRSSTQSYGIAVSGPIPAIQRIDGDQATYYAEPTSPTNHHHTHAY